MTIGYPQPVAKTVKQVDAALNHARAAYLKAETDGDLEAATMLRHVLDHLLDTRLAMPSPR